MKKILLITIGILLTNNIFSQLTFVEPLIQNEWRTYTWPYNAYLPEDVSTNGIYGHYANPCGPTTMARILNYWKYPSNGNGHLQFTNTSGFDWDCDLTSLDLDYTQMPSELLFTSSQSEYNEIAKLFLATSSVVEYLELSNYTNISLMPSVFADYFNFNSTATFIDRADYTKQEWIDIFKNEISNGRPIMVVGLDVNNLSTGHWWVCDGYNSNDKFYYDYSFGGIKGYDDIDSLGGIYIAQNKAVIGLEPDKEIRITSPNGGEIYTQTESVSINWDNTIITDIKLEYTIDNGINWNVIETSLPSSPATYNWVTPIANSNNCKIRISEVSNAAIYDESNFEFSILVNELNLTSLNGGGQYASGVLTQISWDLTYVPDIKIEYTIDNGANWDIINVSYSTYLGFIDWTIPSSINSTECKIKISDIVSGIVFDESNNTFEIANETSHALQFDGMDKFVEVSGFSIPQLDLTIEAWINPSSLISNSTIVSGESGSSGFQLRLESDGSLMYGEYQPWSYLKSDINSIPLNTWTHIALTRQGNNCKLYINGVVIANNQITTDKASDAIYIGSKKNTGGDPFEGIIDEVRIWNNARTQSEIIASVNTYLDGSETNLVGYWQMNEHNGQVSFDLSPNAIDGQLGSTLTSDVNDPVQIETDWPYSSITNYFEPVLNQEVLIYPNPVKNNLFITAPNKVDISIVDLLGRKIIEKHNVLNGVIDVSGYNKGCYLIIINNFNITETRKLIIE